MFKPSGYSDKEALIIMGRQLCFVLAVVFGGVIFIGIVCIFPALAFFTAYMILGFVFAYPIWRFVKWARETDKACDEAAAEFYGENDDITPDDGEKVKEKEQALSAAYLAYQKAYDDYLESQKTLPESASQTREQ